LGCLIKVSSLASHYRYDYNFNHEANVRSCLHLLQGTKLNAFENGVRYSQLNWPMATICYNMHFQRRLTLCFVLQKRQLSLTQN